MCIDIHVKHPLFLSDFNNLLGITKLDKEKNQYIRGKNGSTEYSKGNKTIPEKSGYNTYRGWTEIEYQNKHYDTDQKEDGTLDDRRRDGGTNSTLRIKEQGTHLTLNEHHDDDDDDFNKLNFLDRISKNTEISNFMKILPVGAEILHAKEQTDRRDEADGRFSRCWESSLKSPTDFCGLQKIFCGASCREI